MGFDRLRDLFDFKGRVLVKDESPTETTLWAWNDALTSVLACFVICTVILITIVNKKAADAKSEEPPAGAVSVYIFWPDGLDVDVDAYLADPSGEVVYFGHQNSASGIWNLLRDDLGRAKDGTPRNYENAYARGLVAGEYVINVHLFRSEPADLPVTVEAEVRINQGNQLASTQGVAYRVTVVLEHVRDEKTIIRFRIDENANLIPGSVNKVFKRLVKQK